MRKTRDRRIDRERKIELGGLSANTIAAPSLFLIALYKPKQGGAKGSPPHKDTMRKKAYTPP